MFPTLVPISRLFRNRLSRLDRTTIVLATSHKIKVKQELLKKKSLQSLLDFTKMLDLASHDLSTPSRKHGLSPAVVGVLSDISRELARFGFREINLSHGTIFSHIDTGTLLVTSRRNVEDDLRLDDILGQGAWNPGGDGNDVAASVVLAVSDEDVG
jgi:hypothetical protein